MKTIISIHKNLDRQIGSGKASSSSDGDESNYGASDDTSYSSEPWPVFSVTEAINARLEFLSYFFSRSCTPTDLTLSCAQLDTLWQNVVINVCPGFMYLGLDWFYTVVTQSEYHIFSHELLHYLFATLLPSLPPENVNPQGLQLYVFLQKNLSERGESDDSRYQLDASHGHTFVWDVALKASDRRVNDEATRYILQHILKHLTRNENDEPTAHLISSFIQHCLHNLSESMSQLTTALSDVSELPDGEIDSRYTVLYRSLLVLYEHIQNIRYHYAYQIGLRALEIEDSRQSSIDYPKRPDLSRHVTYRESDMICLCIECQKVPSFVTVSKFYPDDRCAHDCEVVLYFDMNTKMTPQINVLNSQLTEKTSFKLNINSLIADIRALAVFTWNKTHKEKVSHFSLFIKKNGSQKSLHALPVVNDCRPLHSLDMKRSQRSHMDEDIERLCHSLRINWPVLHIVAVPGDFETVKEDSECLRLNQAVNYNGETYLPTSLLTPLSDTHNSLLLLSRDKNFDQLFHTVHTLAKLANKPDAPEALKQILTTAWQVTIGLPTSKRQLDCFRNILFGSDDADWSSFLPIQEPHILLYNLITIDKALSVDLQKHRGNSSLNELCIKRGLLNYLITNILENESNDWWIDNDNLDKWGLQSLSYALLIITKLKTKENIPLEANGLLTPRRADGGSRRHDRQLTSPNETTPEMNGTGPPVTPTAKTNDGTLNNVRRRSRSFRRRSLNESMNGPTYPKFTLNGDDGNEFCDSSKQILDSNENLSGMRPRSRSHNSESGSNLAISPNFSGNHSKKDLTSTPTTERYDENTPISITIPSPIQSVGASKRSENTYSDVSSSSSSGHADQMIRIPALTFSKDVGYLGCPKKVVPKLMSIILEAATKECGSKDEFSLYPQRQIIRNAFRLLVPLLLCSREACESFLCDRNKLKSWLEQLVCTWKLTAHEDFNNECTGWLRLLSYSQLYFSGTECQNDVMSSHIYARPVLHCLIPSLRRVMAVRGRYLLTLDNEKPDGNRRIFLNYCQLICSLLEVVQSKDCTLNEWERPQKNDWPIDFDAFLQDVSTLVKNPPGPSYCKENPASTSKESNNTETNVSLSFYLDPCGTRSSLDIIGVLLLLKSTIKSMPHSVDDRTILALMDSIFGLLFDLPTMTKKNVPLLQKKLERDEAFTLLGVLASRSIEAFSHLGNKLTTLHGTLKELICNGEISWDRWPSAQYRLRNCPTVGLSNMGATCYMNATLQQIFMDYELRKAILTAKFDTVTGRHRDTFCNLQYMFAFLAGTVGGDFHTKPFCETYQMNGEPINPVEQRDMNEFFIDLIDKCESMSPDLAKIMQSTFRGEQTHSVSSLECEHGSQRKQYFYTLQCELTDVKNLHDSLKKMTDKDILEGDNMWNCEECGKKVKAEKRQALSKLPRILCFNTMRYYYDPTTCLRSKVNSLFEFPPEINMEKYMAHQLFENRNASHTQDNESMDYEEEKPNFNYRLIGVTLHLGTAEVGHYYVIVRDQRTGRWLRISDTLVKPFDPNEIPSECFGGALATDATMGQGVQLATEQSNNAYMLFYERMPSATEDTQIKRLNEADVDIEIPEHLNKAVIQSNRLMLFERFVYDNDYYNFVHHFCSALPRYSVMKDKNNGGTSQIVFTKALNTLITFLFDIFIYGKKRSMKDKFLDVVKWLFKSRPQMTGNLLDFLNNGGHISPWLDALCICPHSDSRQLIGGILYSTVHFAIKSDVKCLDAALVFSSTLLNLFEEKSNHDGRSLLARFADSYELLHKIMSDCRKIGAHLVNENGLRRVSTLVQQLSTEETNGVHSNRVDSQSGPTCSGPSTVEMMLSNVTPSWSGDEASAGSMHRTSRDPFATLASIIGEFLALDTSDSKNGEIVEPLIFSPSVSQPTVIHLLAYECGDKIMNLLFMIASRMAQEHESANGSSSRTENPESAEKSCEAKLIKILMEGCLLPVNRQAFNNLTSLWTRAYLCERHNFAMRAQVLESLWPALERSTSDITVVHYLAWVADLTRQTKPDDARVHVVSTLDNWFQRCLLASNHPAVRRAGYTLAETLISNQPTPLTHLWICPCYQLRHLALPGDIREKDGEECPLLGHLYNQIISIMPYAVSFKETQPENGDRLFDYLRLLRLCLSRLRWDACSRIIAPFSQLWLQLEVSKASRRSSTASIDRANTIDLLFRMCWINSDLLDWILQRHDLLNSILIAEISPRCRNEGSPAYWIERTSECLVPLCGLKLLLCLRSPVSLRRCRGANFDWLFKLMVPFRLRDYVFNEVLSLLRLLCGRETGVVEETDTDASLFRERCKVALSSRLLDGFRSGIVSRIFEEVLNHEEDLLEFVELSGIPLLYSGLHESVMAFRKTDITNGQLLRLINLVIQAMRLAHGHEMQESQDVPRPIDGSIIDEADQLINDLLQLFNFSVHFKLRDSAKKLICMMISNHGPILLEKLEEQLFFIHEEFYQRRTVVEGAGNEITRCRFFPRRCPSPGLTLESRTSIPQETSMHICRSMLDCAHGIDPEYDSRVAAETAAYRSLCCTVVQRRLLARGPLAQNTVRLSALLAVEWAALHSPDIPNIWIECENSNRSEIGALSSLQNILDVEPAFLAYLIHVFSEERASLATQPPIRVICTTAFKRLHGKLINTLNTREYHRIAATRLRSHRGEPAGHANVLSVYLYPSALLVNADRLTTQLTAFTRVVRHENIINIVQALIINEVTGDIIALDCFLSVRPISTISADIRRRIVTQCHRLSYNLEEALQHAEKFRQLCTSRDSSTANPGPSTSSLVSSNLSNQDPSSSEYILSLIQPLQTLRVMLNDLRRERLGSNDAINTATVRHDEFEELYEHVEYVDDEEDEEEGCD